MSKHYAKQEMFLAYALVSRTQTQDLLKSRMLQI